MFIVLYAVAIPALLLIIYILYDLFVRKKYKLSASKKQHFQKLLLKITKQTSGKSQIIDLDKLLHKILLALGFTGTFGEILKKHPPIFGNNLQDIWHHHKKRNKLVHEFGDEENKKLLKAARDYEKIIREILKKL